MIAGVTTADYDALPEDVCRQIEIVDGCVIVELKAVATLHEVHEAKVISYLKTTGLRLGYLLNFHHTTMKAGIKRIVL